MKAEQQYIRGFNNGYLLAKYLPNLLTQIVKKISPSNEYFQGFFSGREEYEIENSQSRLNELRNLREDSKGKDNQLER